MANDRQNSVFADGMNKKYNNVPTKCPICSGRKTLDEVYEEHSPLTDSKLCYPHLSELSKLLVEKAKEEGVF